MGGDNFQKGSPDDSNAPHVVRADSLAAELHTPQMHELHRMDAREQHFEQVLEHLARNLSRKFAHAPSQALKQAGQEGNAHLISTARRLFKLAP